MDILLLFISCLTHLFLLVRMKVNHDVSLMYLLDKVVLFLLRDRISFIEICTILFKRDVLYLQYNRL